MQGVGAKELNRTLLSALRRVNKRTTLRAESTSPRTTDRFFDYVLKKRIQGLIPPSPQRDGCCVESLGLRPDDRKFSRPEIGSFPHH